MLSRFSASCPVKSSTFAYWLNRWGFLLAGTAAAAWALALAWQGPPGVEIGVAGVLATLLYGVGLYLHDRVAIIHMDADGMTVVQRGCRARHAWADVVRVSQVPCTAPPHYRVEFRDGAPPVYCVARGWHVSLPGGVLDFSGFGEYAERHILTAAAEQEARRAEVKSRPDQSVAPHG